MRWPASLQLLTRERELPRLLSLMGLFFIVLCALGILRPIRNSFALDGVGAENFYQVYLVSAVAVLFVPAFNALSRRVTPRVLFAAVAWFFAANLLVLRLAYRPASAAYSLVFYGWYDLFASALLMQFFMVTQYYVDARSAKRAYPIVIAGGSIGATLGGAIPGLLATTLGTPDLLLVALALVALFAIGVPLVLDVTRPAAPAVAGGLELDPVRPPPGFGALRELAADRQVRLIAVAVLLTVVVKQLVDYQFHGIVKEVFETRDAVTAFEGQFNMATQWLPLLVLLGLRPALRRWGIAVALLLLPVAMLASAAVFALTLGLWAASAAKGADASMRYAAERFGRELLYVPVRDEIKLKAKAYIDVAVEKGVGKLAAFLVIAVLVTFLDRRGIAVATVVLATGGVWLAVRLRREYTSTLAKSIENRFASLRGTFASLVDASTLPQVRRALASGVPVRTGFALELLDDADEGDVRVLAPELNRLLASDHVEIRAASLRQLARVPDAADQVLVRERVRDCAEPVRDAAVRLLVAASGEAAAEVLGELLRDGDMAVRIAALRCLAGDGDRPEFRAVGRAYVEERWHTVSTADAGARAELALAAGSMRGAADAGRYLGPFLDDPDPAVRSVALRSAALLGRSDCSGRMIAALDDAATREAAADALALIGEPAIAPLAETLLDPRAPGRLRRTIPGTLARIPTQQTVDVMLGLVLAPETDQLLDFRTLKALGKLRRGHPELHIDPALVWRVAEREADHALRYAAVRATLAEDPCRRSVGALLASALDEAQRERREGVFLCLGLLYPPESMRRAFLALSGGSSRARASAAEWLEQTVGPARARRIAAVVEPDAVPHPRLSPHDLIADGDAWIAHLARRYTHDVETGMELIEKVFLLQQVDLLRGARSSHLALLASIADDIDVPAGTVLVPAGEPPTAMYVVAHGSVELNGVGERLMVGAEGAFGTWALIDEEPSLVEARALESSRLLRVTRADFHDLLADHGELALGLLQGLARRVRSLVA